MEVLPNCAHLIDQLLRPSPAALSSTGAPLQLSGAIDNKALQAIDKSSGFKRKKKNMELRVQPMEKWFPNVHGPKFNSQHP